MNVSRAVLCFCLFAFSVSPAYADEPLATIAVLSNPYITTLPPKQIKDERGAVRDFLAKTGPESMHKAVDLVNRIKPDALIVMGSLTWSGSQSDFTALMKHLDRVRVPVLTVPGHRDRLTGSLDEYRRRLGPRDVTMKTKTIKDVRMYFAGDLHDDPDASVKRLLSQTEAAPAPKAALLFAGKNSEFGRSRLSAKHAAFQKFVVDHKIAVQIDATRYGHRLGYTNTLPNWFVGSTAWSSRGAVTLLRVFADRVEMAQVSDPTQPAFSLAVPNPVTAPRMKPVAEDRYGCPSYSADLAAKPEFTFALVSDPQFDRERGREALIQKSEAAIRELNRLAPEMVFVAGDLVNNNLPEEWKIFNRVFSKLKPTRYVAPGNHDVLFNYQFIERSYSSAPAARPDYDKLVKQAVAEAKKKGFSGPTALYEQFTGSKPQQIVEFKNCAFLIVSFLTQRIDPKQMKFLREQLRKTASKRHVFVVAHYPSLPAFGNNIQPALGGNAMLALLREHKVVGNLQFDRSEPPPAVDSVSNHREISSPHMPLPLVQPLFDGPIDIVGDVHGEIDAFEQLLGHLGYADDGGHRDGRRLVLLGDLTDRGPDSPAVIAKVRDLMEAGRAQSVLGNHDLNILLGHRKQDNHWFFGEEWSLDESDEPTPAVLADDSVRISTLELFRTLPLVLERDGIRVLHACWDDAMVDRVRNATDVVALYHDHANRIEAELEHHRELDALNRELAHQNQNPVKFLTSGRERRIDEPVYSGGKLRYEERVHWWNDYTGHSLCVFGHYSLPTNGIANSKRAICIDYSVGKRWVERKEPDFNGTFRRKLAALRIPEMMIHFDDGTREPVKPILVERCYSCHGSLKQESGLRLDTGRFIRKGGDSGPAAVPRNLEKSALVERITAKDESVRMPPEGKPLTTKEIALIKAWIQQGAGSPKDELPQADPKTFWSFQPPVRPAVPKGNHASWVRNPVDAFIAARYREKGLKPNPPADKRTLLRRLFLDLIGLPPTASEVRAFLADDSPRAYAKVVDRLLNSPQYGERWGRHWMDVWRYSDWYGSGNEIRYGQRHLWRWRDWIIRSLNEDKGYDRMILEMLAADEVAPTDPDILPATGFIGRNWYKFDRNVWMRELVEHSAAGFLGVTMKCARCHDHKYDPFSHKEYYRFRAFFEPHDVRVDRVSWKSGTVKDTKQGAVLADGIPRAYDKTLEAPTYLFQRGDDRYPDKKHPLKPGVPKSLGGTIRIQPVQLPATAYVPELQPRLLKERIAEAQKVVAAAKADFDRAAKSVIQARQQLAASRTSGKKATAIPQNPFRILFRDDFSKPLPNAWKTRSGKWTYKNGQLVQSQVGSFLTRLTTADFPENLLVRLRYTPTAAGSLHSVGVGFDVVAGEQMQAIYTWIPKGRSGVSAFHRQNGRETYPSSAISHQPLKLNEEITLDFAARGDLLNVWINGKLAVVHRMPMARRRGAFSLWTHAGTAEFNDLQIAALPETIKLATNAKQQLASPLVKPAPASFEEILAAAQQREATARLSFKLAEAQLAALKARIAAEQAKHAPVPDKQKTATLAQQAARAERLAAVAKAELDLLIAQNALAGSKLPKPQAAARKQLDTATKALAAAKQAALKTDGKYTPFAKAYPPTSTGRRTALARWIADVKNPRTARVAVNHIWLRHFGRPIVDSVADFGMRAKPRSHPRLLDWLAVEIAENGWSMKHIHRLIVMSNTYQLASTPGATSNHTIDPGNRFLWRANSRRMEAEVVRDAVLHLAGSLDLKRGGPEIPASQGQTIPRRSVYFQTAPNRQMTFLQLFDAASPDECYRRIPSVVPQQSLALMNSSLVLDNARRFTRQATTRLTRESRDNDAEFVKAAFEQILCRPPSTLELSRCESFLAEQKSIFNSKTKQQAFFGSSTAATPPSPDPAIRARENLVHVRRNFLADAGMGFTGLALGSLLYSDGIARAESPTVKHQVPSGTPHLRPKAKNVIWLFMLGGTSHMESFDPKPALNKYAGKTFSESPYGKQIVESPYYRKNVRDFAGVPRNLMPKIYPMQVGYRKRGDSGIAISDWWPHLAECADDLAVVRSMWTTDNDHAAQLQFHTGRHIFDGFHPSIGSWAHYGLGSLNDNLPRFVVLGNGPGECCGGGGAHGASYLGPEHAGVKLNVSTTNPLPFGTPGNRVLVNERKSQLNLLNDLNRVTGTKYPDDPQMRARIKAYELAFRMQMSVPEVMGLAGETKETRNLYGLEDKATRSYGQSCLVARRLVERGVRFVQVYHQSSWDAHSKLKQNHSTNCRQVDLLIVAGQSNAVGFNAIPSELPPDDADRKILFWWRCGDPPPDKHDSVSRKWTTLKPQPLGDPNREKKPRQYGNFAQPEGGFGPEIGLARAVYARENKPLAVIKVAFSGTGLQRDWNHADPGERGACYRALIAEIRTAAARLKQEQGITLRPRAFAWVQGESDANANDAPRYSKALGRMLAALRRDLKTPGLKALVAVNTKFGNGRNRFMPTIVAQQQQLADRDPRCVYVDTSSATIANRAHFDSKGTLLVGRLFAEALFRLEATLQPSQRHFTIVTLGDSITKGVRPGVTPKQTFAAMLEAKLKQKGISARVINVGIGGERTDQALKRMKRVLVHRPDIVTVMYGTNDSYVDRGKKTTRISRAQYRANLKRIVAELLRRGIQPILMTEPRIADNAHPNGLGEDCNIRLEPFVVDCRAVAKEWRVPLVDHFAEWSAARKSGIKLRTWTTDGVHPNPFGHGKLASRMLPVVQNVIGPELKTRRKLLDGKKVRVVCFGDSVTGVYYHTGSRRAYTDMLGIALRRVAPDANVEMVNAGISGHTTVNALKRIDRDVLRHKPDLVTVMFGLNDMTRVPLEQYRANLKTIIEKCRAAGAEVLLATPNNVINTPDRPIKKLITYCDAVRAVGHELGVPVCDAYREFDAVREHDRLNWRLMMSDAIHPNMSGHKQIATALAQSISGTRVSLDDVGPARPALNRTVTRLKANKSIRVLAMPPADKLIATALQKQFPNADVNVATWAVEKKTLPAIELDAKSKVRKMRPDLVVIAVPRGASADSQEAFINSYAWTMNWSLNFGPPTWDCIVIHPDVTEPASKPGPQGALIRRLVAAQDLHLIDRPKGSKAEAAEILSNWLKRQTAAMAPATQPSGTAK
eukprot:g12605.t1